MAYDGTSNFSTDANLAIYEVDILDLVNTNESETNFSTLHTQAQTEIKNYLKKHYEDELYDGDTWQWTYILDTTDLKSASVYWVLSQVYCRHIQVPADVYDEKHKKYWQKYLDKLSGIYLEIDTDGDTVAEEFVNHGSISLGRG